MHGLHFEDLHTAFEKRDVLGKHDFPERQKVLDEELALDEESSAAGSVEGGQDVVFGQVDGQLDQLPVQFLEGFLAELAERPLQRQRHPPVVHPHLVPVLLHAAHVDQVAVAHALHDGQLLPDHSPLPLRTHRHPLAHQNPPRIVQNLTEIGLPKGKPRAVHLNDESGVVAFLPHGNNNQYSTVKDQQQTDSQSLIGELPRQPHLLELPGGMRIHPLPLPHLGLHNPVNRLALRQVLRVEVVHAPLLLQLHLQPLLLQPLLVRQPLRQMMPLELRQIFEVPHVLRVEIALLRHHFLPVEGQSRQFSHTFISELHPPLPEAYLFVAALTHSVLVRPVALGQQVDALHEVTGEQLADVVGLHVGGDAAEIAHPAVGLLALEVLEIGTNQKVVLLSLFRLFALLYFIFLVDFSVHVFLFLQLLLLMRLVIDIIIEQFLPVVNSNSLPIDLLLLLLVRFLLLFLPPDLPLAPPDRFLHS